MTDFEKIKEIEQEIIENYNEYNREEGDEQQTYNKLKRLL